MFHGTYFLELVTDRHVYGGYRPLAANLELYNAKYHFLDVSQTATVSYVSTGASRSRWLSVDQETIGGGVGMDVTTNPS